MTKAEVFKRMWKPLNMDNLPPTDDANLRVLIWDQRTEQPMTIRAQVLVGQYKAREEAKESGLKTKGAPGFWTKYWMYCYGPNGG